MMHLFFLMVLKDESLQDKLKHEKYKNKITLI